MPTSVTLQGNGLNQDYPVNSMPDLVIAAGLFNLRMVQDLVADVAGPVPYDQTIIDFVTGYLDDFELSGYSTLSEYNEQLPRLD